MEQLKQELKELETRAYNLKTKKAQDKAYVAVRAKRDEILNLLFEQRRQYSTHSVKGTVRWFHSGDDYVSVSTPYGTLHPNITSDVVSKSWYGHTCCVEYTKEQEIIIEIDVDVDLERLCLELIPKRVIGGILNEAQYAELCKRDDLAFFKYPGSDGVTGLFKQRRA